MRDREIATPEEIIPFHIPYSSGKELSNIARMYEMGRFQGGVYDYTRACETHLEKFTGSSKILLTTSCTHALEMCALLLDIQPGDEVIMPSFSFVSLANAFVLRGAVPVFVDIDPHTLNIKVENIANAITLKTKAIAVMHYGGVTCEMHKIMELADAYNIPVIEDAAHCIDARFEGRHLGSIADLGALSFHATKNIHCGEGGALLINNSKYLERAEIIREKGTNRSHFNKGIVDKYTWVDIGSSYLMSEILAAFLWEQLANVELVTEKRREIFKIYDKILDKNYSITQSAHNAHIYWLMHPQRDKIIAELKAKKIESHFHYVPLHTSPMGMKFGRFVGTDHNTLQAGTQLFRLPIYPSLQFAPYVAVTVAEVLEKYRK